MSREPTPQELESPLYQAIWGVIKDWYADTSKEPHWCDDTDVILIYDAVKQVYQPMTDLWVAHQPNPSIPDPTIQGPEFISRYEGL